MRTPPNGILGFAQLMAIDRDHRLAEEQQRRLDGVQRSGQHMLALVNDVLGIARIEQSDWEQRLAPIDLLETLQTRLAMIQPLASTRNIRFGGAGQARRQWQLSGCSPNHRRSSRCW
ncbi:hypothetical protein BH11PSE8_BH11PSE8_44540 [soil metagenome]